MGSQKDRYRIDKRRMKDSSKQYGGFVFSDVQMICREPQKWLCNLAYLLKIMYFSVKELIID